MCYKTHVFWPSDIIPFVVIHVCVCCMCLECRPLWLLYFMYAFVLVDIQEPVDVDFLFLIINLLEIAVPSLKIV